MACTMTMSMSMSMCMSLSYDDDIWEYIKKFVVIKDYYKMSCVSKKFSGEYNVKRLISNNDMKAVYELQGATPVTILDIINYKVIQRYSYRYNKYIHANITSAIYTNNIFNTLMYNNKLEIINVMYALLYSAINQKYKNIINIVDEFCYNYENHGNYNINLCVFTSIMHFILNYLKDNYNFKRYSEKISMLCKLNLSLIVIITVKTEKIKGIDDVKARDESYTADACANIIKMKNLKAQYDEVINEKILDIIASIIEYDKYFPKFFATFLLKKLEGFCNN